MNSLENTMNAQIAKRIMRRTYYAFAIHMATRPLVRFGVPLVLCTYFAAKLVFVAAVMANAKAVGVANLHLFAFSAITHADFLTLLVTAALAVVFIGVARDAARIFSETQHYA